MKCKKIVNHYNTRGIIAIPSKKRVKHIKGWFNKQYLKEIVRYLDSFENKSVSLAFVEDATTSTSLLLILPDKKSDVVLAVAGRSAP